jgi:hypothetical protein
MLAIDCKCELTFSCAKPLMDELQNIEDCNGMQVHPTRSRCQLGITDAMLAERTDNTSPLEFYQSMVPTSCCVRVAAMRVFSSKAAALGCERLWSGARQIFTDNRRSLRTAHIMQLLNLKLNAKLLCGEISIIEPKEFVQELEASFDSILETVALMEEEEAGAQLAADRSAADKAAEAGSHVDLDDMENNNIVEEVAQQPLDMFLLD